MEDHPRPQTAEEFMALPEFGFGSIERVIDGKVYQVPTQPAVMCVFHEKHDIIMVNAPTGRWMLGRYADGRWFRRRM